MGHCFVDLARQQRRQHDDRQPATRLPELDFKALLGAKGLRSIDRLGQLTLSACQDALAGRPTVLRPRGGRDLSLPLLRAERLSETGAYERIRASTSSRFSAMWSAETSDSRLSRSSGSVLEGRTLKCQSE